MKNQTTGLTPFELMFGRESNIPSTIAASPTVTHQELFRKWKHKHEENLKKKPKNASKWRWKRLRDDWTKA